ncbi:MAG: sulfotransferase [Rhodothermaceae bacterium]|nr:MAG: sulfotransferase [Rhodothermaceae bacterium]
MSSPEHTPSNPFVFVVGCPRSGTTLLQRMLDSHPQLAVANDTHFIPRVLKRERQPDPPLTEALVERTRTYRRFYRLGLSDEEVRAAAAGAPTYRAFVGNLYTRFARRHGKPLAGEKTPDYGRHLPLLNTLFPQARFIHILRDGRNVALSTLSWASEDKGPGKWTLWRENPVATCALWWRWQMEAARRDGALLGPDRYLEVRYEALVQDPERVLRSVTAFLGLPYHPAMKDYHVGKTRHRPGLSAKSAWLPPVRGLRDWRTQWSAHDTALFEALAGDALTALGYERAFPAIAPDVRAEADRCLRWWHTHGRKPERRTTAPSTL